MKNYKVQDGCWNCKFVFHWYDECTDKWYCNITNDRPRCGSLAMGNEESQIDDEDGKPLSDEESAKRMDTWYNWSDKNEVKPYGICEKWKP